MPVKSKNGEIWKDIPNYEGYYQASNLGRIKSLDRTVTYSDGRRRFYKGRIRDGSVQNGYKQTTLRGDGIGRNFMFSQIIAVTFLGHEPKGHTLVVDHINGDKLDNRVGNLRIVTHRENSSTCFRSNEESLSSGHVGVSWIERDSVWRSQISLNGVSVRLGCYDTEIEASTAYQEALSKIEDGSFNPDDYKPKFTSKYKGVYFNKRDNKWVARITINGKTKYLGSFTTEIEAHQAYQSKLKELQVK